jgi:hypothetical protein
MDRRPSSVAGVDPGPFQVRPSPLSVADFAVDGSPGPDSRNGGRRAPRIAETQMPKDPLPPILFLHVGWARLYRGDADDPPLGAFGYIADGNEDPGETLNFKPFRGRCHGYAPHAGLNLARLGAERDAAHADGVLVVFTATNPDGSGRYVVGWYRDARVYPGLTPARPSKHRPDVLCSAKAEGCHLVNVDDRTFFVPSMETGWPGVASAFYANEHLGPKDVRKLLAYVGGKRSKGFAPSGRPEAPEPPIPPGGGGDPEARKQVEEMAVSGRGGFLLSRNRVYTP